jgi:molecular chaperone DnaK
MIPNSEGDILTPSLVLFDDSEVLVGKEARKVGILQPARYAECVKRDMGSAVYSRTICGEYMPPEVIQAWILKKLKADIYRTIGPDMQVVITVPAFFDEQRRKATADAGTMAALPVLDVVNEPTAAALAFGEELGYLSPSGTVSEPLTVLVYDLGGGTFDVTLLEMRPGDLRTVATDGDVRLGGRDWDMRLADLAAETFIREHREDPRQNPASLQRLLIEVEEAKRTLSARQNATIRVDHAGSSSTVRVSRQQFEQITADLLERTSYTTRQLLTVAGKTWQDVNRVLLVGGSTRMPMVGRMLQELSGIEPDHRVHPDEAVARGAAIYAGYLLATQPGSAKPPAFEVTDVNSHSLGIEGIDPRTMRKRNVVVLPRNTPLPAKVKERFVTKSENQRSIVVQVLEGESAVPTECTPIGRTVVRDLPPGLPPGWPVEIHYEYGTNGRLKVKAQVPGTDREVQLELERESSLSAERLSRWKQIVSHDGGFDDFSDLIAQELQAAKAQADAYRPVANAEHVVAGQHSQTAVAPRPLPAAASATPAAVPAYQAAAIPLQSAAPLAAPLAGSLNAAPAPAYAQPIAATAPQAAWPAAAQAAAAQPVAVQPAAALGAPAPTVPNPSAAVRPTEARPIRRTNYLGAMINVSGFLLSSLLGLIIGYYVLCYVNPKGNFLHLPPNWFPWQVEQRASDSASAS